MTPAAWPRQRPRRRRVSPSRYCCAMATTQRAAKVQRWPLAAQTAYWEVIERLEGRMPPERVHALAAQVALQAVRSELKGPVQGTA